METICEFPKDFRNDETVALAEILPATVFLFALRFSILKGITVSDEFAFV